MTKNAGKACNNRLYRHIRTFEKIVKNYFVISPLNLFIILHNFFYCNVSAAGLVVNYRQFSAFGI